MQTNIQAKPEHRNSRAETHGRRHVPGTVLPFLVRELVAGLTTTEWLVWSILFLHANRGGFCCLKHETVASECGIGWNAVHKAKRGLIAKGWLENCGQRDRRGPNNYHVRIHIPKPVNEFIGVFWDRLNEESWWKEQLGDDTHAYAEDHIEWLVAWRVIRTLKECDAALRETGQAAWKPQEAILPALRDAALTALLDRLRLAAKSLNLDRGEWWLFGDGFDEVK